MVRFRIAALALSALICGSLAYLAATQQFELVTEMFNDKDAIKVEIEKKPEPEKPPPPPPPKRELPPPPPIVQRQTTVNLDAPPTPTPLPVEEKPLPNPPAPPPPAPPAPPAPPQITPADFIQRPNGADFAKFYPSRAAEREKEGRVVLDCTVNANGSLSCSVASEDPSGWGFGEASLKIARQFKVRPKLEDGRPTDGGSIRVPISWRLG